MKKSSSSSLKAAFVFIAVAFPSWAQAQTLSYDGSNYSEIVKTARGNRAVLVTGNRSMEVRLYTTATAGTIVAKETFPSVNITSGKFNIKYGNNGIADNLSGASNWVAVAVAGVELKPRVQLVTVPFALHSGDTKALRAEIDGLAADTDEAIKDLYDKLDEAKSQNAERLKVIEFLNNYALEQLKQLKAINFRLDRVDTVYYPGEEDDADPVGPHTGWDDEW